MPAPLVVIADFVFPNYMGGSGRLVHSFLKGLEENGLDFRLVTRPSAGVYGFTGEEDPAYARWTAAGKVLEAGPFSFRLFRALRWCTRETVLNIHHPVLALFFIGFAPRKRVTYFFHGPWHEEFQVAGGAGLAYRLKRWVQVFVLKKADRIFVLSDYFKLKAGELIGDTAKITVIPAMLETRGDLDERNQKPYLRKRWAIPPGDTVLFTSRRLTPRTGVLELTRLFRGTFGTGFHLIVVGKGELQRQLESEVAGCANIRYLNYVSESTLRELMILADAYVLPTLALEGFGMVLLEAMDTGLPVVSSDTSGGGREFLESIDPRLIFSMKDGETLKAALKVAREEFGVADWLAIARKHDIKTQARRWHDLFS